MKKVYSKPGIVIEEFQLSQNISFACGVPGGGTSVGRPRHASGETCAWDINGYMVFVEGNLNCSDETCNEDQYDGLCYNNPTAGNSVFASY